ncbi:MAG: PBSX family phage terminase large subunit [Gammaproteobacteria bacterium]|nr:PBSX family phage terminase large subunit [Gammaproteobacteria bacterium]
MSKITLNIASPKFKKLVKKKRYKLAYGGRGGGKSYTIALLLLTLSLEKKVRILCTRQIQKSIKDSVHKLFCDIIKKNKWDSYFNIKNDSIISAVGSEFIFKGLWNNINEIKSTEGINYCWVEEAQSISKEALDILIPTIREPGSEIWFSFNRFAEFEPVWITFNDHPEAEMININYYDNRYCPDVLIKEAEYCKAKDISQYLHIWEGHPLSSTSDGIIDRDLLMQSINRDVDDEGGFVIGVDVARFGNDRTCIIKRKGFRMTGKVILEKKDTVQVAEAVKQLIPQKHKSLTTINIDDTGVGGGVSDILIHDGYSVNMVNFGENANDVDRYCLKITELWFEFKSALEEISLMDDPDMLQELLDRKYGYDRRQRKMVESKDLYKKRCGRSPDLADACLLCFMGAGEGDINYNEILEDLDQVPDRERL